MTHRRHPVTPGRFYNFPGDKALGYPRFNSFQHRQDFIRSQMLQSEEFIQRLQRLVAEDTDRAAQPLQQIIIPGFDDLNVDVENQEAPRGLARENDEENVGLANGPANIGIQELEAFADMSLSPPPDEDDPSRVLDIEDHKRLTEVVFVGISTAMFSPNRGDLIIYPPGKNQGLFGKGYVASYVGPGTHWFEHGELVVRIGLYEEDRKDLFRHKPYRNLELYQYNMDTKWKYLGSQVAMANTEIPIDTSPGKYLKVGASIVSVDKFTPLVPRRGDVIIKREAWKESYAHQENFWHSMVKWHRDGKHEWNPDDLLIRLFVDRARGPPCDYVSNITPEPGDHSACVMHGVCQESHPPPSSGFAELYARGEGNGEWLFWGRTKLLFDTPFLGEHDPHLLLYVQDDGQYSDFNMEEEEAQSP